MAVFELSLLLLLFLLLLIDLLVLLSRRLGNKNRLFVVVGGGGLVTATWLLLPVLLVPCRSWKNRGDIVCSAVGNVVLMWIWMWTINSTVSQTQGPVGIGTHWTRSMDERNIPSFTFTAWQT